MEGEIGLFILKFDVDQRAMFGFVVVVGLFRFRCFWRAFFWREILKGRT
jgi:hypothetical protein